MREIFSILPDFRKCSISEITEDVPNTSELYRRRLKTFRGLQELGDT